MHESPLFLDDDNRIAAWRADRADMAEKAKAERLAAAEKDRTGRLLQFEADKERRIEQNRLERAAVAELVEQKKTEQARTLLAGSFGSDPFSVDYSNYGRKSRGGHGRRLAVFVVLPAILFGTYLMLAVTPLYQATAIFSVSNAYTVIQPAEVLADGFIVRRLVASPSMMLAMEKEEQFPQQFVGPSIDFLQRIHAWPWLGLDRIANYRRYLGVAYDMQDGLLTLKAKGQSPEVAMANASRVLKLIPELSAPSIQVRIVSAPYADESTYALNKLKIFGIFMIFLLGIYTLFTVFVASLKHYELP